MRRAARFLRKRVDVRREGCAVQGDEVRQPLRLYVASVFYLQGRVRRDPRALASRERLSLLAGDAEHHSAVENDEYLDPAMLVRRRPAALLERRDVELLDVLAGGERRRRKIRGFVEGGLSGEEDRARGPGTRVPERQEIPLARRRARVGMRVQDIPGDERSLARLELLRCGPLDAELM